MHDLRHLNTHGGPGMGAGRKKTGRCSITIRISEDIPKELAPNAAGVIRELVEMHYAHLVATRTTNSR